MDEIFTVEFQDQKFYFNNTPTAPTLIHEIFSDNYDVLKKGIEFRPGDVILDIGACEGMFSIMMSKLFPQTRIIAIEPIPRTINQLDRNIKLNGCQNIEAYNVGIGKKGQKTITMNVSKEQSGGSTSLCTFVPTDHYQVVANLISLDDAFELYNIDRCRLLKLDAEGMEYDILYFTDVLPRIDYMTAEFHMNQRIDFQSRRPDALAIWCSNQVDLIHVDFCKMAE